MLLHALFSFITLSSTQFFIRACKHNEQLVSCDNYRLPEEPCPGAESRRCLGDRSECGCGPGAYRNNDDECVAYADCVKSEKKPRELLGSEHVLVMVGASESVIDFSQTKCFQASIRSNVDETYEHRLEFLRNTDSWHHALKFKCKFERKKFLNDGEVAKMRQRYGKHSCSASSSAASSKRQCSEELLKNVTQMEDQRSVEGHIRSMKNEMQNATPNIEKLHDSMERTFSARRQWIRDAHLSMHGILEQYPALEKPELIFHEFELIGGKSPLATITEAALCHIDTVLQLTKNKLEPPTLEILQMSQSSNEVDKKLLTTLAFLMILPRTMKEKSSAFVKATAPWFSSHPCAIWETSTLTAECVVMAENQILKTADPVQAILLCFCLHWVVDMCYQPEAKGFFSILENLLGLSSTKLSPTAICVLSAMKNEQS